MSDGNASAQRVLAHYPQLAGGNLVYLGNHGGFSGARLWRLDTPAGSFCLKVWPADWRSPAELAWIHEQMRRAAAFPWMPRIISTNAGETFVVMQGRLWEVATWMPGVPDFSSASSSLRLEATCIALAQLHQAWADGKSRMDICPAIQRRWDAWQRWHHLVESAWQPAWTDSDPLAAVTKDLWRLVEQRIMEVPKTLTPWLLEPVALQSCVCDLWHDHVLFTGQAVTGLIDFGSLKEDNVAVDLARLLGSLIGNDATRWHQAIAAYRRIRPLSPREELLARDLDRTGVILAATNWLRWLFVERRQYDAVEKVALRLTQLADRLQGS